MYYEELRASVREGKIAPLYVFEGAEEYLIEFCIDELKKKLIDPAMEMMNYKSYNELPSATDAGDFLEMLPVMSERKLVIFRKCGLFEGNIKSKAQWEQIVSQVADFNCVVIWEDPLEKGKKPSPVRAAAEKYGVKVEFALRTESNLKSWVAKIAAASGKTIDNRDASYLIASLERKMRLIKTELDKIISFSSGSQITRADIDAVIVKPAEENVFDLIEAVFAGRREVCYNLLNELEKMRQKPVSILALLSGQIINIYHAKLHILSGLTPRQAAQKMGGGYAAEKSAAKAEKIKVENLEFLIHLCRESDRRVKQGLVEPWAALELIIAEYRFY